MNDEILIEIFFKIKQSLLELDSTNLLNKNSLAVTALCLWIIIESARDVNIADRLMLNFYNNLLEYNKDKREQVTYEKYITILTQYFTKYKNILNKYLEGKENWKYNESSIGNEFLKIVVQSDQETNSVDSYKFFLSVMNLLVETKQIFN